MEPMKVYDYRKYLKKKKGYAEFGMGMEIVPCDLNGGFSPDESFSDKAAIKIAAKDIQTRFGLD